MQGFFPCNFVGIVAEQKIEQMWLLFSWRSEKVKIIVDQQFHRHCTITLFGVLYSHEYRIINMHFIAQLQYTRNKY